MLVLVLRKCYSILNEAFSISRIQRFETDDPCSRVYKESSRRVSGAATENSVLEKLKKW